MHYFCFYCVLPRLSVADFFFGGWGEGGVGWDRRGKREVLIYNLNSYVDESYTKLKF